MTTKTDAEFEIELKKINDKRKAELKKINAKRKKAADERKLAYAECMALVIKSGSVDGKAIKEAMRRDVKSAKHRALLDLDNPKSDAETTPPALPITSSHRPG